MSRTPWIGLIALLAMFAIPFLPDWLFEGPRTVRHRPRRHICGDCEAPWTDGHMCLQEADQSFRPLHSELLRLERPSTAIKPRTGSSEIFPPSSIPS